MRSKYISAIAFCAALVGCATSSNPPRGDARIAELQSYIASQKPLAQNGQIKWSDYYAGLIDRHIQISTPLDMVEMMRLMLLNAQQMERGVITADEFEYRQQELRTRVASAAQQYQAQAQAQRQADVALAMQFMQRNQITPYQIPAPSTQAPQRNTIQPIQIQPVQPTSAATATAYWTGKQVQVQTVTYQSGWNCEYTYAGNTFWRTFVGNCPTSVGVQ